MYLGLGYAVETDASRKVLTLMASKVHSMNEDVNEDINFVATDSISKTKRHRIECQ